MNNHLTAYISELPEDTLVILYGNSPIIRNGDVYYSFRQSSDFLYLTGISSPDLILTISNNEVILWRDPISEKDIIWGSDKWTDIRMIETSWIVYIRDKNDFEIYKNQHSNQILAQEIVVSGIHKLRLIKTPDEIEIIKKAIQITEKTYEYLLWNIQPGMYEYEIEAMIAYQFRRHRGIEAFPSIVASGSNACILHYTANNRKIETGDLVLIDFGVEIDGYGADISRTFVVGGIMNSRQQEIYNAVLQVKWFAENTLKPGITRKDWNVGVKEYMFAVCSKLWLDIEKYTALTNPYFPHSIGHFLGLDTHDVGDSDIPFAPGMILTIEPGIYIPQESIGIRVEDDYLITESGCEKL